MSGVCHWSRWDVGGGGSNVEREGEDAGGIVGYVQIGGGGGYWGGSEEEGLC